MEKFSELAVWIWIGCGFASVKLLTQSSDKFVFEHTFWGQMKKNSLLTIVFTVGILGWPILLIIYLLLPRRKINSHKNIICEHCGHSFQTQVDIQLKQNQHIPLARFSNEIQLAIAEGQKRVNMPIPFIMAGVWILGGVISFTFDNPILMIITFFTGFMSGWLWWSFAVPRWREWALKQPGVTPDELQHAAELALLVWPKNHFFEKTEIRPKK
ncbi:MAG: hypothetical protein IPP66_10290 [Anaerolineales bacterium]|nr:hypothetical protein [Anaerolineales bacterium]